MRLNLGAGRQEIPGYIPVDLPTYDLARVPWPWPDESCGAILASHILEHFSRDMGRVFLAECARLLRPRAVLGLAVPDMDRFITARLTGDATPLAGYRWTSLDDLLGGGAAEPVLAMRHQYLYCWASLAYTLQEAGLTPYRVTAATSRLGDVHSPDYAAISLYVDAVRR